MRSARVPWLLMIALVVLCFGLAAYLDIWFENWQGNRKESADMLNVLLGDSRRIFANHFFTKADAYFHSGYYPTIFDDRKAFQTAHMAEDAGAVAGHNKGDEMGFLGKPRDWIDAFSRKFFPSVHTHLDEGGAQGNDLGGGAGVREILPWLRLSAELDPHRVETYTTTAYWLRNRMGRVSEAERFLREGLNANPNSYEIMFELGRIYAENKNDPQRASNLWEAALSQWEKQESGKSEPDTFSFVQIISQLSTLEVKQGQYQQALGHMELWKQRSPNPEAIQQRIDELLQKMAAEKPASAAPATNAARP